MASTESEIIKAKTKKASHNAEEGERLGAPRRSWGDKKQDVVDEAAESALIWVAVVGQLSLAVGSARAKYGAELPST